MLRWFYYPIVAETGSCTAATETPGAYYEVTKQGQSINLRRFERSIYHRVGYAPDPYTKGEAMIYNLQTLQTAVCSLELKGFATVEDAIEAADNHYLSHGQT